MRLRIQTHQATFHAGDSVGVWRPGADIASRVTWHESPVGEQGLWRVQDTAAPRCRTIGSTVTLQSEPRACDSRDKEFLSQNDFVTDANYRTWRRNAVLRTTCKCARMNNIQATWFEGNFKEYDADLRRRKGADADTPHRVTYKKLVRS